MWDHPSVVIMRPRERSEARSLDRCSYQAVNHADEDDRLCASGGHRHLVGQALDSMSQGSKVQVEHS